MSVNLGRVAYVEKGAYDGGTVYQKKDVVFYNNGSFVFIADVPAAGIVPTDSAYWQPMLDPTSMNQAVATANQATETANRAANTATTAANAANTAAEAADNARLAISDELNKKAPAIFVDASGEMVHITDGAAMPVQSLVTQIAPVQSGSGDPSPDNVRPISGWDEVSASRTGKNLLPGGTHSFTGVNRVYFETPLPPGAYTLSGMAESTDADVTQNSVFFYKISSEGKAVEQGRALFGRNVRESHTLNLPNGADYAMFCAATNTSNSSGDACTWTDVQLESGEVATAFEPHNGETLTAALPETVYGGMLDWTTGLVTVTHKRETISRMSATHTNAGEGYLAASVSMPDMKSDSRNNGLCETMKPALSHVGATSNCIVFGANNQTLYIAISTELAGTTRDSLNAYLAENPLTVVYPLAEPYTIQLTPQQLSTLKGVNNIWSDAVETAVSYAADTKLYIDNKIAAIAAAIV